jgi:methyl-accepting chemotaxis protein
MIKIFRFFTSSIQRRMFSSFAGVVVLVIGMAVGSDFQLGQVQHSSERLITTSSQIKNLQGMMLSLSSLEDNLEYFFLLESDQFREAIQQDLDKVRAILEALSKERATMGSGQQVEQLGRAITQSKGTILALLEATDETVQEKNERRRQMYSALDESKALLRDISAETLRQFEDTATRQEGIVSEVILQLMLTAGLVSLLVVLISLAVARTIATPVTRLTSMAQQIAAGDLEHLVEIKRQDEIGTLSAALARMTNHLRTLLYNEQGRRQQLEDLIQSEQSQHKHLQEINTHLQQRLGKVRESAGSLRSAAGGFLAAMTEQTQGAHKQSAAIAETTATIEEIKALAAQMVAQARELAGASQRTVEVSQLGHQSARDTIERMVGIQGRVEGIAEHILNLTRQTQNIQQLTAAVNEIAAQSNILALNAGVEAARLGEQGRGFAIVAAEVRGLAEHSEQAMGQMQSILSEIRQAIDAAVMATEEGTEEAKRGVTLAEQTGDVINRLSEVLQKTAEAASQMATKGQQQASGVQKITASMDKLDQTTQQGLTQVQRSKQVAQKLNELTASLTGAMEQLQA